MRASTLTFIFIISEYSIITGGDGNCGNAPVITNAGNISYISTTRFRMMCKTGYLRKAGTSSLFVCENNTWKNSPSLICTENPNISTTPHSTFTTSTSSHGTQAMNSTPTESGKIVSTTTHTASIASRTSHQTTQRIATTTEQTSVTSSPTARIPASSTTEKDNFWVSMSSHSSSSHATTSTVPLFSEQSPYNSSLTEKGITAGLVIIIIVTGLAIGVLFWCRRSRSHVANDEFGEMKRHSPDTDQPLMRTQTTGCSYSPDSTEPPYTDSSEITIPNL